MNRLTDYQLVPILKILDNDDLINACLTNNKIKNICYTDKGIINKIRKYSKTEQAKIDISKAAEENNIEKIKLLWDHDVPLKFNIVRDNMTGKYYDDPTVVALKNNNLTLLNYLLKLDRLIRITEDNITYSIDFGMNVNTLEYLLNNNLVVLSQEEGNDILKYVSNNGYSDFVKYLLSKGYFYDNILYDVVQNGNINLTKYLLDRGVKNNLDDALIVSTYVSDDKILPMMELLLDAGADPHYDNNFLLHEMEDENILNLLNQYT